MKQGDPISALLFVAVMEVWFRSLKKRWNNLNFRRTGQYYGFVVDSVLDPLTNLRFADDVLLLAQSKADVVKMLRDLKDEAAKYGLAVHLGKTKILTNSNTNVASSISLSGHDVAILKQEESERYLGRQLSLGHYHEAEFTHRLAQAWKSFAKFRKVLCSRKYPLRQRMRLFESVVTPVVLYGCECWTMGTATLLRFRTARRKMLRSIFRVARSDDESWVDYIRRATVRVDEYCNKYNIKDWGRLQAESKLHYATRVFLDTEEKWNKRLLDWTPWFRTVARRSIGRPSLRWGDAFRTG